MKLNGTKIMLFKLFSLIYILYIYGILLIKVILKTNKMKDIDIIKKDIKALKRHYKECNTSNTIYLRPVLKSQIEMLQQTMFNLEVQQFKDFI